MTDLYIDAGMDVIAVWIRSSRRSRRGTFWPISARRSARCLPGLRSRGAPSSLFVCGDATKNVEIMCHTGPDAISMDENIDLMAAKRITDRHGITIGGNIPLTPRCCWARSRTI